MNMRQIVAANVRARLAFHDMGYAELEALGWKTRTITNRLRGRLGFTAEELAQLAVLFGLDDPGVFYRVPDGFGGAGAPLVASSPPSSLWDLRRSAVVQNRGIVDVAVGF